MKTLVFFLAALSVAMPSFAADSNVNYDQVREDYRAYLREIKKMSQQYKEFTGEMKKVLAEEGFPTWSDEAGIQVVKPVVMGEADVKESAKDMTVKVDLPGLKKDTIKVTIENEKMLRIQARRKQTGEDVERLIELPSSAEGAKAQYEDGVLSVTAKKTHSKAISVPVR